MAPGPDALDRPGPNASLVGPGACVCPIIARACLCARQWRLFELRLSSFCVKGSAPPLFRSLLFHPRHQPTLALNWTGPDGIGLE